MRASSLAYFRHRVKATLSTTEDPDAATGTVPLVESNGARQVCEGASVRVYALLH